jgi:hypothetical protein
MVRIASPILLGAGGWCLGLLIVLTAFPEIPLNDQRLVAASVAIPIALAAYGSWVDRDWPPRVKAVGAAAGSVGALLGGWLGYAAGDGLPAVVTTIVGAAVGANLVLVVLDVVRGRAGRGRMAPIVLPAEPGAVPAPRAGPPASQSTPSSP